MVTTWLLNNIDREFIVIDYVAAISEAIALLYPKQHVLCAGLCKVIRLSTSMKYNISHEDLYRLRKCRRTWNDLNGALNGRLTKHNRVLTNRALFLDAINFTFFAFYDLLCTGKRHRETKGRDFCYSRNIYDDLQSVILTLMFSII